MGHPNFDKLVDVVAKLRDPENGCPWDLEQSHSSLLEYLIEEAYEFIGATELNNRPHMEEELGDILLQVLLHCQIAKENQDFDIESVSEKLADKLIRRHPHVFAEVDVKNSDEVVANWQKIKAEEKGDERESRISDKYLQNTALQSAHKIGKKTKKLKFDWDSPLQVAYKVEEEWQELKEEVYVGDKVNKERVEEELGDLLFSTVQLARHLDINSEEALRKANIKFIRRFQAMEKLIEDEGIELESLNQSQMDVYWDKVKLIEKDN